MLLLRNAPAASQKKDTKEVIFFSHFQLGENFIRDDVASGHISWELSFPESSSSECHPKKRNLLAFLSVIYDYAVIGTLYVVLYYCSSSTDENGGKRPAKNCFNNCNIPVFRPP